MSLLLPVRVLAASLSQGASHPVGVGALPDISSGLKVAIDLGAHVLNLSFGTAESDVDPHGPLPHADVVQYADAQGARSSRRAATAASPSATTRPPCRR